MISQIIEFKHDISLGRERYHDFEINLSGYLERKCLWLTSVVFWKKEAIVGVGGFDEGIMKWQDWLKELFFCKTMGVLCIIVLLWMNIKYPIH
ncbi:hypothetical protein [Mangrovimonas sp. DI 80]|uniref:hypothetical protein n=1 Tax=Mangrovimonas sp. DI 80 TaxID=1779330 RepID=UPI000975B706|nr:hypothetical protein [Mangrovimonas sp. DI 80]OMP31796.1 hypothetical protein BKM32_01670 [Mangrovimonas sp. DI 80]